MRALSFMVLLGSLAAWADADPKFAKLRDNAEAIASLGGFIDQYAGTCGPKILGGAECEKNADTFRRGATGKKFYMIVTEETAGVLSMGDPNPTSGGFTLNLTPFFGAGGSGLSHGAPSKTDKDGNPILPFLQLDATLPDGWNLGMMARQVMARGLRLQVVFTPQGLWQVPKRGGGMVRGVKAKFNAVLVTVGRTGEQVALWTAKD